MPDAHLDPDRQLLITGVDANIIGDANSTAHDLHHLFERKLGLAPEDDLSAVLPVQLGKHCESFILNWLERRCGSPIVERQSFVRHPVLPFAVTLDGVRTDIGATVDAKMVNPYAELGEVKTKYTPQAVLQMRCRQLGRAQLAVLRGFTFTEVDIEVSAEYERALFARLVAFHECLLTMTPPTGLLDEPAPVPPEQWRTVDLATAQPMPNWSMPMIQSLRLWSDTRDAVKLNEQAKRDVKDMLPDDVGTVLYGDTSVRRSKNGAVTIREKEMFL